MTGKVAKRSPSRWSALAALPAAVVALLPSVTCPACLAAYVGVLSSLGLGVLAREEILGPLVAAFLLLGTGTTIWSSRSHERRAPIVLNVLGTAAVIAGRFVLPQAIVLYAGVTLILISAIWNLWLKRPKPDPLVQLRSVRKEGAS